MQFAFFSIPADNDSVLSEELNRFLRSHRVISVQRELSQRDTAPCWRICVEYLEGPMLTSNTRLKRVPRVDYKEILSESDFKVFVRLRDVRKELAARDAAPVYAVCTNEHLAEMAKRRVSSLAEIQQIDGFGEAKTEKYGEAFIQAMKKINGSSDETGGEPD